MLDVISPCVTFNDHEGSTKSYSYVKDHDEPVAEVNYIPHFEDITIEHEEGTTREVSLHDGSRLYLRKLDRDYDPTSKLNALQVLHETSERGEYATGLLYIEPDKRDFCSLLNLVDEPLAHLPLERYAPLTRRSRRDHGRTAVGPLLAPGLGSAPTVLARRSRDSRTPVSGHGFR